MAATNGRKGSTYDVRCYRVPEEETPGAFIRRSIEGFFRWCVYALKQVGRGILWVWSGGIRWVFLTVMFIYLLNLALALFEADSFQVLVGRLAVTADDPQERAGTARVREVVQVVRSLDAERTERLAMKAAAVQKADLQKATRDAEARAVEEKTRIAEAMTLQQQKFAAAQRCTSAWAAAEANARAAGFCYQEQTAAVRLARQAPPATPAPPAPPAPDLSAVPAAAGECDDSLARYEKSRRHALRICKSASPGEIAAKSSQTILSQGQVDSEHGEPQVRLLMAAKLDTLNAVINGLERIGTTARFTYKNTQDDLVRDKENYIESLSNLQEIVAEVKGKLMKDALGDQACKDPELEESKEDQDQTGGDGDGDGDGGGQKGLARACLTTAKLIKLDDAIASLAEYRFQHVGSTNKPASGLPKGIRSGLEKAGKDFYENLQSVTEVLPALRELLPADSSGGSGDLAKAFEDLDEQLGKLEALAANQAGFRIVPRSAPEYQGGLDPQAENAKPKEEPDKLDLTPEDRVKAFDKHVADLRTASSAIRDKLQKANVNFEEIGALRRPFIQMGAAVQALDRIEVLVDSPEGLPSVDAKKILDQQKEASRELLKVTKDLRDAHLQIKQAFELKDKQGESNALILYLIADVLGAENSRSNANARTIWREYQAMERFQSVLTPLADLRGPGGKFVCQNYDTAWRQLGCQALGIGFSAKNLAVNPRQNLDLMVVFVLGAIGSLIFITQKQLRQIIEGHGIKGSGATGYLSWYWFRPIFGVVIAFAIYLLYKTGAAALGSGTDSILAADVNLPMLALISLFAGLLSWHALDMIETRGRRWLDSQKREDLYASGLEAALRNAGRSPSELAVQIARTPTQIDRWIAGRDKVTPEMQDRISTWLDRPRIELFSKDEIDERKKNEMRWATGLKRALDNADTSMDVEKLAVLLGRNPEIVEAWRDLRLQVEPAVQLQLAEALKMRPADLFDKDRPDAKWWAHGLRVALEDEKAAIRNAEDLAVKVESSIESIHRYMELEMPVPKSLQESMASALDLTHSQLFTTKPPMAGDFMWASKLRSAMRGSRYKRAAELAEAVDTDVFRVRAWMEMEICEGDKPPPNCGQVAQATRKRVSRELGVASETIFRVERADGDFKWAVMPLFGDKVKEHGILAFAESFDVDKSRVECWMERSKPVAPETQLRIKEEFGLAPDDEGLFEWVDTTETKLLEGEWWATNLRAAIRGQGTSVASLAGTIGGSEDELHGYVELEGPVPAQIRAKLARALGVPHEQIFVQDPPSPKKFLWAPYLRGKMAECGKTSADLAREIGGDVGRIRNWMEMEDGKNLWRDDKDNQVLSGMIAPETQQLLADALGCAPVDLFGPERPKDGLRWVVRPSFGIAVEAFVDESVGFLREADVDAERFGRWLNWQEQVQSGTWRRINVLLGLPEGSQQLFDPDQKTVDAQG